MILKIVGYQLGTGFDISQDAWVTYDFKALVTGLPKKVMVEPGIHGKTHEVYQEESGQGKTVESKKKVKQIKNTLA